MGLLCGFGVGFLYFFLWDIECLVCFKKFWTLGFLISGFYIFVRIKRYIGVVRRFLGFYFRCFGVSSCFFLGFSILMLLVNSFVKFFRKGGYEDLR